MERAQALISTTQRATAQKSGSVKIVKHRKNRANYGTTVKTIQPVTTRARKQNAIALLVLPDTTATRSVSHGQPQMIINRDETFLQSILAR